ncbi:hypothetical protein GETHPA_13590 [Geothrix rubra]|uniref:DinB-like domain-containing protein n=1 Tax=Geothrix rubra TaxID=2927977 RepID=A0ABQ5Q5X1_9BACT|nr:DinB family protein [Geothrix rubra]GLH69826.1 hypothetical protein GETHPA_13590 [Geothrix rubra]
MSPDDRAALLLSYAQGPEQLRRAVEGLPAALLDARPAPGAWTIREVVVHVAEAELHGYLRMRFAMAQEGVTVLPYDQEAWAATFAGADQPLSEVLDLFRLVRELLARQLRSLSEAQWARSVRHPEAEAPLTLEALLARYEHHLKVHLAQIARTHRAVETAAR